MYMERDHFTDDQFKRIFYLKYIFKNVLKIKATHKSIVIY